MLRTALSLTLLTITGSASATEGFYLNQAYENADRQCRYSTTLESVSADACQRVEVYRALLGQVGWCEETYSDTWRECPQEPASGAEPEDRFWLSDGGHVTFTPSTHLYEDSAGHLIIYDRSGSLRDGPERNLTAYLTCSSAFGVGVSISVPASPDLVEAFRDEGIVRLQVDGEEVADLELSSTSISEATSNRPLRVSLSAYTDPEILRKHWDGSTISLQATSLDGNHTISTTMLSWNDTRYRNDLISFTRSCDRRFIGL